jgi:hypothetical protein
MPAALSLEQKKERAEAAVQVSNAPVAETTNGVRRKRGTFNGTSQKLAVNASKLVDQGYHVHIVNDMDNRVNELLDRGYEFVLSHEIEGISTNTVSRNTDIGDKVRFLVGTQKNGEPLQAYLMKIKKEWYEEDMQELQDRNDKIDESIRRGVNGIADKSNFYSRDGDIKMKT